ncbi:MAG: efflux RND transporter periplasmic adaptor subunit [Pseudomonadota bacterium]
MQNTSSDTRPRFWMRWVWISVAIGVLVGVLLVLSDIEDTTDVRALEVPTPAPRVSVVTVTPETARAEVSVFAELRPQWDAEIRTAVSGRVIEVHTAALAGTRVAEGAPLFSLERTPYETAVATAEMTVEQARLALLQAENQAIVARRQFERDGEAPPNDLALYLPQRRIAERSLAAAEAQLEAALRQLDDTIIKAPFSGIVTSRVASLGQSVAAGEALLHLSDDRQFELVAELSQTEWALLEHPIAGGSARLFHRDGRPLGTASIRQGGGFLDPVTRQIRVFLAVADPNDEVLSGDFLRVTFEGRQIEQTLTLPETALTRAGHVWFVSDEGLLERTQPEILFRTDATITIPAPQGDRRLRVAITPLALFLPGQRVTPHQTGS